MLFFPFDVRIVSFQPCLWRRRSFSLFERLARETTAPLSPSFSSAACRSYSRRECRRARKGSGPEGGQKVEIQDNRARNVVVVVQAKKKKVFSADKAPVTRINRFSLFHLLFGFFLLFLDGKEPLPSLAWLSFRENKDRHRQAQTARKQGKRNSPWQGRAS